MASTMRPRPDRISKLLITDYKHQDIYMNTEVSNDSLKNELTKQFTSLYGQPLANAETPTWEIFDR